MKKIIYLFALISITLASCGDDETVTIDSSKPDGVFTAARTGTFVEQNSTGTKGMASIGVDSKGVQFIRFDPNFSTSFATGTVTVYLSKSATLMFDPGAGNPTLKLVGPVAKAGENFFKVEPTVGSEFTHVILWCGSAGIPFGNSPLN